MSPPVSPGPPGDDHLDPARAHAVAHSRVDFETVRRALAHARACAPCDRLLSEAAEEGTRLRAGHDPGVAPAAAPRPHASPSRRRRRRLPPGVVALATVATVAVVVATWIVTRPSPLKTGRTTLGLPGGPEIVRLRAPGEQDELPRLEHAIRLYEQGRHVEVTRLIEEPFVVPRLEPLRRLYRASALLELGRTADARETLEPLAAAPLPDPYDDWRDWALRAAADPADQAGADSILRALAARPGPLRAKARSLLEPPGTGSPP
jgi:hypothetical protein